MLSTKRRFGDIAQQAREIFRNGDLAGATKFLLFSMLNWKFPVWVKLQARRIWIRPATPDFLVAKSCFSGEFDGAIAAANPLGFQFIVDAGGYIGTSAIVLAEAFPTARIICLEPSQANFAQLCRNVAPWPNIIALKKALGPNDGIAKLIDRRTGEWGFSIVERPVDCINPELIEEVEVTSIPSLLGEFGANGIDILKLDIEGGERDLLYAEPAWLDMTRVIVAELHDRIVPGCRDAFDRATRPRSPPHYFGNKVLWLQT
ncbi:FkbM family methyltransferase [Rhodopseudomonas rhenobacensis]|uniref:FkbM family methyltransferase n=1 Tax=Rhodopseudomonas rhenobacensis TaxID=87461 RepID=A0A7W8DYM7_9BRAD|nr:FkbM family methyltransferase [Rhodopseudomonas rhenobacensis]MBB5047000.1 FkbM family methyltransferase [Rhodopseudomonas rhenobacensis]